MNELTTTATLTPEIFKSKIQIALSKAEMSIQALHDAESNLVYNEDNLETIARFLKDAKATKKFVDDERKKLKEPSLQEGRAIDAGAKLVDVELDAVIAKANLPYQKLCQEVERKQKEAEAERQRIAGIREQMNNFKNAYAAKIAAAQTSADIVIIERLFNLESANTKRYAEFIDEFRTDCEAIRSHLRLQKEKVRELEDLEKQRQEAAKNGLDEQFLEIMDKIEAVGAEIAEKRVNIQEEALKQSTQPTESATVILPLIPKGSRRFLRWELIDIKAATKRGWTKVVLDEDLVDQYLNENKGEIVDEIGIVEGGVRFFIQKKF